MISTPVQTKQSAGERRPSASPLSDARRRLISRLRDESGMAIPIVMLTLFAGTALATAAVVATMNAQAGSTRDQNNKEALAAAEAGVNEALLHYNKIALTNPALPCINASGVPSALPAGSTWCAPVGPVSLTGVDGVTYTYRTQLREENIPNSNPVETIPTLEIV